jgi:L-lysine 6-transaminase
MDPTRVHDILQKHQLADGMPLVVDLERSHGVWLHDARSDVEYLDAFTCFASWPMGFNNPDLRDPDFLEEITRCALTKLSNSDLYTVEMALFVEAFGTIVTPEEYPYHFWISGGALAVENALKTAFDWKARKLGRTSFDEDVNDLVIMHFEKAFHGRSGYTMSLTNTVPDKIGLYPKFHWPRVHSPAIVYDLDGRVANDIEAEEARTCAEMEAFFTRCPAGRDRKTAAIIIEPMQGEGGDNHFRPEFLAKLRQYADEQEALLIFDEVQTGFYGSGEAWMWQHYGVHPDVVAFGKKTQVCGIYAGRRLDEVDDHVFQRSSRINSTWGGNLVDMVRARRFIELMHERNLVESVKTIGARVLEGLRSIARETGAFTNVRGVGSFLAFTFESAEARDRMVSSLFEHQVIALPCGETSVRFRLPFVMSEAEADTLLERTAASVPAAVGV